MNMKFEEIIYPQYYDVNDIPVVLKLDGDDVVGKSANGMPYSIGKAIIEGINISKAEYDKMAKDLYGENFDLILQFSLRIAS